MDVVTIVIAAIVGVAIGILSGMLGIGGGTVMVPVFKLGFGMSAIGATATSLFAIIPTAISGSITHVKQKTCIPKLGILAGVGGACFSPAGVWLASQSPGWLIMLAAAIVIGYSSFTMFKKAAKLPKRNGATVEAASQKADAPVAPSTVDDHEIDSRKLWLGLPIGMVAGLIAGYVGVGGGFLMVPLFLSVLGVDMKRASGSSLLAIAILSTPGAITQIALGNVAIAIAIAAVVGSVPGAVLGARLAKRIPERELRFLFGGVLLFAAVMLVLQEVGLL
ncbi:MAG: sulfite exporter TauE/SafE family protein [Coriobacteriia bacterium]|nr:sulfite exporter TauE/SafE family protein [Coriobacteriia bacterium]